MTRAISINPLLPVLPVAVGALILLAEAICFLGLACPTNPVRALAPLLPMIGLLMLGAHRLAPALQGPSVILGVAVACTAAFGFYGAELTMG
ncbi:MAG: hypothetical protein AAGC57_07610 [Pseudomonadota bacterium]